MAGREERAETIRDGNIAKQNLMKEGVTVHPLTSEEKDFAKQRTSVVYNQFSDFFTPGFIDRIKKQYF